ncbi:MAG TPA: TIGR00266 family protein [Ruminococcus sp.]|nr:TIGR00266 family protein [Ruminococcus sp.]
MQYEIQGKPYPVATVTLAEGESVICQRGAMAWMTPNVSMQTTSNGGIGKMLGRMVSGESLFQNIYTSQKGQGMIAFATNCPGEIMPIELDGAKTIIAQKSAFLASSMDVKYELYFQKKFGAGFFGGEGFIMQKFTGHGSLLLEIDGSVISYELGAGQSMLIDTGYLAAMEGTCSIDIEQIKGIGNIFLGGEGLFNTRVTGPGKIWIQTMPIFQMANALSAYVIKNSSGS